MGLVGFVAVLLTPGSGTAREIHHVALIPLLAAFVAFALLSVGFMAYFHLHPNVATPRPRQRATTWSASTVQGPAAADS